MTDPTPYALLVAPVEDPRHAIYLEEDVPRDWEWRWPSKLEWEAPLLHRPPRGTIVEARPRPVPPVVVSIDHDLAAEFVKVWPPEHLHEHPTASVAALVRAALDEADHG